MIRRLLAWLRSDCPFCHGDEHAMDLCREKSCREHRKRRLEIARLFSMWARR